MFERIARLTYDHPKPVLGGVVAFVAVAIALGAGVGERLLPAGFSDPDSESSIASERNAEALGYDPEPGLVVLARADQRVTRPTARAEIRRVARAIGRDPEAARVVTPFSGSGGRELVSRDGRTAAILAHFETTDEGLLEDAVARIPDRVSPGRLELEFGGFAVGFNDVNEAVREDLLRAELIAFPVLAILLLLVFRGLVAAALPLAIGGIAVTGTFLVLRGMSEVTDVSIFALNITTALGLGLAVDYGLLLVSRYREELERRGACREAHRVTVLVAGRTVFFSGMTVAAALVALVLLPQRFLYSMGAGGASVAVLAMVAALLATPAMLALLGERVNSLGIRRPAGGSVEATRWYRLAQAVMRRPVAVALATAAGLLAVAAPFAGATLTMPGTEAIPRGNESRDVSERLADEFTPHLDAQITASVAAGPGRAAVAARRISRLEGVRSVSGPRRLPGGGTLISAVPADPPLGTEAQDTASRIRAIVAPLDGLVSGQTAQLIDFKDSLVDNGPAILALIALTTMVLLFLLTGSVILPVKTLLMNVLSILAAFGIMVLVFQEGLLAGLLGYDGPAALETGLIVVLAAATFGLATDYAVLVLARIKEFHDSGEPNERAVSLGIARTGRVITAAALLLAVVFLAFTTGNVFFMKQAGLGQAVAVGIDASIVRAFLVPALMRLLGRWNWWAPRPLRRLHQRLGLAGSTAPGAAPP